MNYETQKKSVHIIECATAMRYAKSENAVNLANESQPF